ncbi:RadC family protein [Thiohalorhabdus methylotrophus]|uniref:DNA repair protein RadC n=1 Tax=Thiohalorhabdus methylotrophus TaxID=3242694 RepID=A0ABV4TSZ8_9GAMM
MAITDWPAEDRPREKLADRGPEALTDAELLAIFLRTGSRGRSAVDLARDLLDRFGGLRPLLAADEAAFCAAPGLGAAKYVQLRAVTEMTRRYLAEGLFREEPIESSRAAREYLTARLRERAREVFAALFLDTRHRVMAFEELFQGTIDGAAVHPRELVKRALHHNAAAVIVAHNHPSGVAEPSAEDERLTARLRQALELVEVRLLDHFVIGDGEAASFAQRGLL